MRFSASPQLFWVLLTFLFSSRGLANAQTIHQTGHFCHYLPSHLSKLCHRVVQDFNLDFPPAHISSPSLPDATTYARVTLKDQPAFNNPTTETGEGNFYTAQVLLYSENGIFQTYLAPLTMAPGSMIGTTSTDLDLEIVYHDEMEPFRTDPRTVVQITLRDDKEIVAMCNSRDEIACRVSFVNGSLVEEEASPPQEVIFEDAQAGFKGTQQPSDNFSFKIVALYFAFALFIVASLGCLAYKAYSIGRRSVMTNGWQDHPRRQGKPRQTIQSDETFKQACNRLLRSLASRSRGRKLPQGSRRVASSRLVKIIHLAAQHTEEQMRELSQSNMAPSSYRRREGKIARLLRSRKLIMRAAQAKAQQQVQESQDRHNEAHRNLQRRHDAETMAQQGSHENQLDSLQSQYARTQQRCMRQEREIFRLKREAEVPNEELERHIALDAQNQLLIRKYTVEILQLKQEPRWSLTAVLEQRDRKITELKKWLAERESRNSYAVTEIDSRDPENQGEDSDTAKIREQALEIEGLKSELVQSQLKPNEPSGSHPPTTPSVSEE